MEQIIVLRTQRQGKKSKTDIKVKRASIKLKILKKTFEKMHNQDLVPLDMYFQIDNT